MEDFFKDVRFALRMYRKNPGFSVIAILALAIGIGAATTIFGLVSTLLLHPLPYPDAERLMQVGRRMQSGPSYLMSYPRFRFIAEENHAFESLAAYDVVGSGVSAVVGNTPYLLRSLRVSGDFFSMLGVPPYKGRSLTRNDDQPGAPPVAVLSYKSWAEIFGRDPAIVGRSVQMSGDAYTIAGIMPASFKFIPDADVWLPLRKEEDWSDRVSASLVTGRLRPGVTAQAAQQDLDLVEQRLKEAHPDAVPRTELSLEMTSYRERVIGNSRPPLQILAGAAACILLVACASVANLLLARAIARRREVAVRIALGVSRLRMARQLLTESIVLALISGALGVGLAAATTQLLKTWLPAMLPRISEVSLNAEVLLIAFIASLVTGVIFGLAPAVQLSGLNSVRVLRESGRASSDRRSTRLQGGLVSAELALSTILLLATGLLLVSFQKLRGVDLGFNPNGVVTFQTSLAGLSSQSTNSVMVTIRRVLERVRAIPGVQYAATVTRLPTEPSVVYHFEMLPKTGDPDESLTANWKPITPDFFKTMEIKLQSGRTFTAADDEHAAHVIIVNSAFVRKFLQGVDPMSTQIVLGRQMGANFADEPRTVVGIVSDTRDDGLQEPAAPTMYLPTAQIPDKTMAFLNHLLPLSWVVRANGDADAISGRIRQEIFFVDPQMVAANPRPLRQILSESIARQQTQTVLVATFGIIALFMGVLGLYGVVAQSVGERRQEIGIRLALGADGQHVVWMMIKYGLKLIVPGLIAGTAGALAARSLLSSVLYGIQATNVLVMAVVLGLLALVAFTAALLPALRARNIDPNTVLHA
ncbi:MAG: ABC transporter permease [Acidobacteriia bacterium]|nr:ABC transporter permease [Terriglobia bacterium]